MSHREFLQFGRSHRPRRCVGLLFSLRPGPAYPFVLLALFFLATAALRAADPAAAAPVRFLVMGDPQYQLVDKSDPPVWKYQSGTWAEMPDVVRKTQAKYFFVVGDIFGGAKGDGSTLKACWDEWDRYLGTFDKPDRVQWQIGGHEFEPRDDGLEPKEYYLKRYPRPERRALREGDYLYVLMDNWHAPEDLDKDGLAWLEETLTKNDDARFKFVFYHVGPRNTATWWTEPDGVPSKDCGGFQWADVWREKMAPILEKHHITAAFSGHDHAGAYLGNRGGFDMFVVCIRFPLMVEVADGKVSYRWLLRPHEDDPVAEGREFSTEKSLVAAGKWQWARWPAGEPAPALNQAIKREELLQRLGAKGEPAFHDLAASGGKLAPDAAGGDAAGDDAAAGDAPAGTGAGRPSPKDGIVLRGEFDHKAGWSGMSALLRTNATMMVWLGDVCEGTYSDSAGRFHSCTMGPAKTGVIPVLVYLPPSKKARELEIVGDSVPPILTAP